MSGGRYGRGRIPHEAAVAAAAPQLRRYLKALAPVPEAPPFEYLAGVELPMWGNDTVGDCTCCTQAALVASWTHAATGSPVILAEADVVGAYAQITGFTPTDPKTDTGAPEPDVLDFMMGTGIGGHRINGHAAVDHTDLGMVHFAAWVFGGLALDLALPKGTEEQADAGRWQLVGTPTGDLAPGADGFHEVALVGVTAEGGARLFIVRTWAERVLVTEDWFKTYVTGAWAQRAPNDFAPGGAVAANGIDFTTWNADLARVGSVT